MRRILSTPTLIFEKIAGVVQHNVLDQIHASAVQGIGQLLILLERAKVRIHPFEVCRPIAVIAAIGAVPPLV